MIAEDGCWVDEVSACVAALGGGCGCDLLPISAEDPAGDVHSLHGVVLADAAGHEEALDEAENGSDAGPEEEEVKDAEAVAAEIEVVEAEAAEEES